MSADKLLFTVGEAAEAMSLSRATIYRLFATGELEWVQIGARRRVTAAAIEKFITEHQVSAA